MPRVSKETIKKLTAFIEDLPADARNKCVLCNETLIHLVKKAEADTGAGTATVSKALAESINKDAAPGDKVSWKALQDRTRYHSGADKIGNSDDKPDYDKKLKDALKFYGLTLHPAGTLFPFMTEPEYNGLTESIKENGLREPIRITGKKELLDGKCRLCAVFDTGTELKIETYNPIDPIKYVMSENLIRTHHTEEQKVKFIDELKQLQRIKDYEKN